MLAVGVGLFAGIGALVPLAHGEGKASTIGVDEIKEGMKGYGLTVFKGTEPERFDVEVVGVLHNFRPSQELILIKTPHPRLNVTKNVRGMSGSPIYLDGRLAGAYAYSWAAFQVEPVAGVTPIAPMLSEMRRPIPAGFWPLEQGAAPLPPPGGPVVPSTTQRRAAIDAPNRYDGVPGEYDIMRHAAQVKAKLAFAPSGDKPIVPAATPLMLGGMSDRSTEFVRKIFGPLGLDPLQTGGGGAGNTQDPTAPQHYVNGGSLGVAMVRGDVSFFGLGTVTQVEGTKLCGFGHPMMEAGTTALPAAIGRVHWIFASDQHSSKIGESVRPLGALTQDRQSAVVVDENMVAPVFPVNVEIKGVPGIAKPSWKTEVAEERFMAASLAAAVFGSVVEATTNERRDVTWQLKSKISVRGRGTIEVNDFGIAAGGMPDTGEFGQSRIVRIIGDVLNNPWEHAHIERVDSVLVVDYARETLRLRGAELLDPTVDPGTRARVRVHLFPQFGAEVTKVLDIKIPEEFAGRDVDVDIIPGWEIQPEVASPENLGDMLANASRSSPAPRSLVAQIRTQQGVAWKGHVTERLPSFALDSLRPQNTDQIPDAVPSFARTYFAIDKYIEGRDHVRIHVRADVK